MSKLSEIGPIPKFSPMSKKKVVSSPQPTRVLVSPSSSSASSYSSRGLPPQIISSDSEVEEKPKISKKKESSEFRQIVEKKKNGYHKEIKAVRDISPKIPLKLNENELKKKYASPKPETFKSKVENKVEEVAEIPKGSLKVLDSSSSSFSSSSSEDSDSSLTSHSSHSTTVGAPRKVHIPENLSDEDLSSSDEEELAPKNGMRHKSKSFSTHSSASSPVEKVEKGYTENISEKIIDSVEQPINIKRPRSPTPFSSEESDESSEYAPSDVSIKKIKQPSKKGSKNAHVLKASNKKVSGPPAKKAKVEKQAALRTEMPVKEDDKLPSHMVHEFDYGPSDFPSFKVVNESMLSRDFWDEQWQIPKADYYDEPVERDYFVIPIPALKPGVGATIRYNRRNAYQEYEANIRFITVS